MFWVTCSLSCKLLFPKFTIILNILTFLAPLSSMHSCPTSTTVMATHKDVCEKPTNTFNLAGTAASWQRHEWLNNPEQLLVSAAILSQALERTHMLVTNPTHCLAATVTRGNRAKRTYCFDPAHRDNNPFPQVHQAHTKCQVLKYILAAILSRHGHHQLRSSTAPSDGIPIHPSQPRSASTNSCRRRQQQAAMGLPSS